MTHPFPVRTCVIRARAVTIAALCTGLLSCVEDSPPETAVTFEDVAAASNLDFLHHNGFSGEYYYVETFGSGAAFLDFDGDGWLDVYLVDGAPLDGPIPAPPPSNKLYRSSDALTFVDVGAQVGGIVPHHLPESL